MALTISEYDNLDERRRDALAEIRDLMDANAGDREAIEELENRIDERRFRIFQILEDEL